MDAMLSSLEPVTTVMNVKILIFVLAVTHSASFHHGKYLLYLELYPICVRFFVLPTDWTV